MGLEERNDYRVSKFVSAVLSLGAGMSFLILAWGSILYLAHPGAPAAERTITGILAGAARLNPSATINLGLLVLLLIPVTSTIAAATAFAMERAWKFVLVSISVLAILSISTAIGYLSGR